MAPGDVVPDNAKQQKSKEKRPGNRMSKADYEPDGSFVYEAHEAWKDFHNSLRHFYKVGELCDVTLKVGHSICMRVKKETCLSDIAQYFRDTRLLFRILN